MSAVAKQPYDDFCEEAPFKQKCYISTPDHIKSCVGRFFYIYTGTGQLERTSKKLVYTYQSGKALEIDLDSITSIERGRYSWWAKPTGLDYIAIEFECGKERKTLCFTPTRSAFTSTSETNKIVTLWLKALADSRRAFTLAN